MDDTNSKNLAGPVNSTPRIHNFNKQDALSKLQQVNELFYSKS
jgi:hypothetical protein